MRRYSTLLSRIFLVLILLAAPIFIIKGFKKYLLRKSDTYPSLPIRQQNLQNYKVNDEHPHSELQKIYRESSFIDSQRSQNISSVKIFKKNRVANESTELPMKIANRPVSVYVHFDLKGAPPKISYFAQLFPLLRKWGVNGICMEYEDMFPFDGIVTNIKHKYAYTKNDIEKINQLAMENHLDVMPLLQTYGHLEFVLKLKEFSDLRENPKYPQVITPCINRTYTILFSMIDQYLNLHPDMHLFHIGHDEVYYFLTNPACQELQRVTGINDRYELFAHHLSIIANYIRNKKPSLLLFIWHDVLQNLNLEILNKYNLLNMINPILWSYREDVGVEGFIVGPQSNLFGQFQSLWGASAFKGATDEIATISDVKHYYDNQVSWIQQVNLYISTKWKNFDGIILTGWSRYDHFLSLCELLPYSIPSLAFSLAAWKEPYKSRPLTSLHTNTELRQYVDDELHCSPTLHLNIQEHTAKALPKCKFPGAGVYESMISIIRLWTEVEEAESYVKKYVTDLHVKYNYIHIKRGEECLEKLLPVFDALQRFIQSFRKSMDEVFPEHVAVEWLETYFMKRYRSFSERYEFIRRAVQEQNSWLPRPIPDKNTVDLSEKTKR